MYITVTFNPSIDYIVFVDGFEYGKLNRAREEHVVPGGKGLNVSMVLSSLGKKTKAFAFTGGITGDALNSMDRVD
ncbi:MAG: PfkB family carbohydrate kinase [Bullifex sp.]